MSTNPGAGGWTKANVDGGNVLFSVSCPSASLCVAVDRNGNVVVSSHPTGGRRAWTVTKVAQVTGFYGVSCASVSLCVAVDEQGDVVTSTSPTGGASAWQITHVKGGDPLRAVSCPSVSLCVAIDLAGDVVTSTSPTGGAWQIANVENTNPFEPVVMGGVSCPSVSLCVVADGSSHVLTSTNPTGGVAAWTVTRLTGAPGAPALPRLQGVSCPSVSMCVSAGAGDGFTSTDPTGGAGAWIPAVTGADNSLGVLGVSCPSISLCVLVDNGGVVVGETAASLATHVKAQLLRDLAPTGKARTIAAVIKHRGYALSFSVPTAGKLASAWYYGFTANRQSRRVLAATGKRTVTAGGTAQITIHLTTTGKQLLKQAKRLKLTAESTFTPVGAATIVATKSFSLKR